VHVTSGMLLREPFYKPRQFDQNSLRHSLGLNTQQPTGLVMFGGHGSRQMLKIAQRLNDIQLIFVCGHNSKLAKALRAMPRRAPHLVVEFTDDVSYYMAL